MYPMLSSPNPNPNPNLIEGIYFVSAPKWGVFEVRLKSKANHSYSIFPTLPFQRDPTKTNRICKIPSVRNKGNPLLNYCREREIDKEIERVLLECSSCTGPRNRCRPFCSPLSQFIHQPLRVRETERERIYVSIP